MRPLARHSRMNRDDRSDTISSSLLIGVRTFRADAWRRLLHIYGPLVFYWCRKSGVGAHDAEDLGQEVFRAVATRIDGFERTGPSDTFGGWLRTITRHKLADHWRKKSKQPDTISAKTLESKTNRIQYHLSRKILPQRFKDLSTNERCH